MLHIMTSTGDELLRGINVDDLMTLNDLELPYPKIRVFSVFGNFRLQCTFQE